MGSASGPRVISGFRRASMTITRAGAAHYGVGEPRLHGEVCGDTNSASDAGGRPYLLSRKDFKLLDRPGLETPHFPKLVI
jgi:hypothetical protein